MDILPFMGIGFVILLLSGMPIGFAVGSISVAVFYLMDVPALYSMIPQRFFAGLDSFTLMAMPFFIFAGEIMNSSRITHRIVEFANVLIAHIRGGLAHVNVIASIFFAGMTGAAVSDAAALGSMLIPAMVEDGYDEDFAAAVTGGSSIIGPTIPPSNMMVLYGAMMGVSIAGLFAAGILPGIILGIIMMVVSAIISKRRNYPKAEKRASLKEIFSAFIKAFPALLMPIIILGGILLGVFTPTEAAAVAVFYAFLIGYFVYGTLNIRDIPDLLESTARTTGVVFLIIASANIMGWILANQRIPEQIAELFLSITENPLLILLLINILMLIVGMFMDIAAALVILGPVLHPIAVDLGVSPIQFGIIMVFALNIALKTPPVGACLYVLMGLTDLTLEELTRAIWPYILASLLLLFLITYVDFITLLIPSILGIG
ncbi:TRAP transporter large permease [Halarsenatibacter silvermanii]|uniref:TRAP transporter, DctM subunit n=1 Tax=Halarsenatibacter silvermanii TaxID=321763 RepID=A0A1G9IBJ6_9FIRM|nr:TRAP transporter large permease [Halarsenatibacter silvermanii]SDL22214.1 TRAP transporter, DctM subunit [Halarsenatibacter silvermanii]